MQVNRFSVWKRLRHLRSFAQIAALGLIVLVWTQFPPLLRAQTGQATVIGTVYDVTEAVIPGATVTLINQDSGEARNTRSNGTGLYSFSAIPAGTYQLRAEAKGFETFLRTGIVIHANTQVGMAGIHLKPGKTSEMVQVSATSYQIPLSTGAKTTTINSNQIQNLAIIGRDAVQLLKVLPGVVNAGGYTGETSSFDSGVGSFNVNGTRNDELAIVSDGADNIDPGSNTGTVATPNVEMISEMTVQTSNFEAENAKGPVVISTVTKAGGKDFHGSAYFDTRLHQLNANDWQNNANGQPRPKNDYRYPGFTIGGPVLIPGTKFNRNRDKLFFFSGLEFMRQGMDLGLQKASVPTAAMAKGDFSQLPASWSQSGAFSQIQTIPCQPDSNGNLPNYGTTVPSCSAPGVFNPAAIDPGGAAFFKVFPQPNADPATHQGYNYLTDIVNPLNRYQFRTRVDYDLSDNTKAYFTYNHDGERNPAPFGLWLPGNVPYAGDVVGQNYSNSLTGSLVNVFSPTTTNELQVGISRLDLINRITQPDKVSRKALGYPYHGIYDTGQDVIPNVTAWGGGFASVTNVAGFNPDFYANKWLNTVRDDLSKVSGNHLLKFGVYYEHVTFDQPTGDDKGTIVPATWAVSSTLNTGNAYGNLLLGNMGQYYEANKVLIGNMADNDIEGYAQDTWKVTPRLTLTLGLRVFDMRFMYDRKGRIAVFDPTKYQGPLCVNPGVNGCGTGAGQTPMSGGTASYSDYSGVLTHTTDSSVPLSGFQNPGVLWAPHFGFAYDLTGSSSTVLRGGFGTYYYRDQGNVFIDSIDNPPLYLNSAVFSSQKLADYENPSIIPAAGVVSLKLLDPTDNRVPTTYSYSLTVSTKVPLAQVLEVSYVGNSSHNQVTPDGTNINYVPEGAELAALAANGSANDQDYRLYQNYSSIQSSSHVLTQNYNSLQVMLRRDGKRLSYSAAYTFGKALGVGGAFHGPQSFLDPFNIRGRSYGVLPYDVSQQLSLAYNYLLPDFGNRFGHNVVAEAALNGWQISGISQIQSGMPVVPTIQGNGANFSANYIDGTPDTTVHPLVVCDPTQNLAPGQYFNAACFKAPSPGNNGNYQIPYIHGPMFMNHDLSLFKTFALGHAERQKLQLRFEAFNLPNHPLSITSGQDTGLPYNAYGALPTVTKPSTANPTAPGYLSQKSGHRILQLAIKYTF